MQRTPFSLAVLITLGLAALFGVIVLRPEWFAGVLGRETLGHVSQHFREPHHRVHDIAFSLLIGTAVVGLLAQLRAPSRNVAGQLMALAPFLALLVAAALTNTAVLSVPWIAVGASTFFATLLHPAGRGLLRPIREPRASRSMLALLLVAAGPLVAFVSANLMLQRTADDDHAALGHYGYLAALGLTVLGVTLVASLRPDGWKLAALWAGAVATVVGLVSLIVPDAASSLSPAEAAVSTAWGIAFAATALRSGPIAQAAVDERAVSADVGAPRRSVRGIAGGILLIALVVVLVFMHLAGGGFPGHVPTG